MIKKLGIALVMLFIMQGIACAGVVSTLVATGAASGSISPSGNLGYKTTAIPITITAGTDYTLDYVTRNGVKVQTTVTGTQWSYTVQPSSVTQLIYVYFKKGTSTNPPVSSSNIIASAPAAISAAVNTPVTISGATSTILYLQSGTKAKFKWTSTTSPPVVTFSPISSSVTSPAYINTSFKATTFGIYTTTLTLTAPGAATSSTKVVVTVQPPGIPASVFCLSCHSGWTQAVAYSNSPHAAVTKGPSCQSCHNPGLNLKPPVPLNHPGYSPIDTAAKPGLYYSCVTCHYPGSTIVTSWPPAGFSFHSAYTNTNKCVLCHDPHTTVFNNNLPYPHFANSTTSAQFVNPNVACANCHSAVDAQGTPSFNIYSANYQWAQSGKGNPKSPAYVTYQFKSMGTPAPAKPATSTANDCVRCHTTTGYINYVSSELTNIAPFGPALGSREMIACSACHYSPFNSDVDVNTGTSFDRRVVGVDLLGNGNLYVTGYYGYSSAQTGKTILTKVYDDKGDSNICITCHTGKAAGSNITSVAGKVGTNGSFWQNVQFMSPHYMGSAGILFQAAVRPTPPLYIPGFKIGYEYRAWNFYNPVIAFAHPGIGDGVQGPCVACHMDGSVRKHLFSPVSSSRGVITAITSTTCDVQYCHANSVPSFNASFLQSKKDGYQASLTVVAALLAAKGIYFNPVVYPYFFTTSDPLQQNFGTMTLDWTRTINSVKFGSDVMGAAFNLKLLQTDAGSWAHNDIYTKRLLYDTIDFLDDGNPNNNTVQTTINSMSIDQTIKTKALGYIWPRP